MLDAVTDPLITSSRACSSPIWTSDTSTFFLHARFPLREGCLCCCGASTDRSIVPVAAFDISDRCSNRLAQFSNLQTSITRSGQILAPSPKWTPVVESADMPMFESSAESVS